jgi:hypothetical protein
MLFLKFVSNPIGQPFILCGSNPGGGQDFLHLSRPALGPTLPFVQGVLGLFAGSKALNTHPHLEPRLKKEWSCTFTPPLGLHGLFWGELYFFTFTPETEF